MGRWRMSVAHLLVALFGLLILVGFSSLSYIVLQETRASLIERLTEFAENAMNSMTRRIASRLQPVGDQLRYLSRPEVAQIIADDDFRGLGQMLNGALAGTPQVLGLGFVGTSGVLTHVSRDNGLVMIGEWRQRSMPQIQRYLAQPPEGLVWLDPQWSEVLERSILPVVRPVSHAGEYLGLMVAVIAIEDLSEFLAEVQAESEGVPFVLFDDNRVLAYPLLTYRLKAPLTPAQPLPSLQALDDPVLLAHRAGESASFGLIHSAGLVSGQIRADDQRYILLTRSLSDEELPPWIIGTYFNWRLIEASIERIYLMLGAGLLLLLFMLGGAIWFSRRISGAVNRIVQAFDSLAHEEVDRVPRLQGSHITELDRIASAFNLMVHSLRDYECVKSQFVRYVPDPVANRLLKSKGVLEPQEVEATVLFCDLQDFTALSQRVRPSDIVEILNGYFTVVAEQLEAAGGVITQFQGDAVLAIFNVPLPLEQHAERAVKAALSILQQVDQQQFAGHQLNCRIGICTGPVIAGLVGAKARVNYTVHGDTVNRAARLEALNKAYATRILLDEATKAQLSGTPVRMLGETSIRGRQGQVRVFTPVAS